MHLHLGAAVETQNNGQEALALLRSRQEDGDDQFDLVLSDVYMPDMDGFKLLEHIGLELELPVISELRRPLPLSGTALCIVSMSMN